MSFLSDPYTLNVSYNAFLYLGIHREWKPMVDNILFTMYLDILFVPERKEIQIYIIHIIDIFI